MGTRESKKSAEWKSDGWNSGGWKEKDRGGKDWSNESHAKSEGWNSDGWKEKEPGGKDWNNGSHDRKTGEWKSEGWDSERKENERGAKDRSNASHDSKVAGGEGGDRKQGSFPCLPTDATSFPRLPTDATSFPRLPTDATTRRPPTNDRNDTPISSRTDTPTSSRNDMQISSRTETPYSTRSDMPVSNAAKQLASYWKGNASKGVALWADSTYGPVEQAHLMKLATDLNFPLRSFTSSFGGGLTQKGDFHDPAG